MPKTKERVALCEYCGEEGPAVQVQFSPQENTLRTVTICDGCRKEKHAKAERQGSSDLYIVPTEEPKKKKGKG